MTIFQCFEENRGSCKVAVYENKGQMSLLK